MKKILCLLFILITPLLFCGCESIPEREDYSTESLDRFVFVKQYGEGSGETIKILVDKETKIMYMYYQDGGGYSGTAGLTVMLNADGTPMLWEGELE